MGPKVEGQACACGGEIFWHGTGNEDGRTRERHKGGECLQICLLTVPLITLMGVMPDAPKFDASLLNPGSNMDGGWSLTHPPCEPALGNLTEENPGGKSPSPKLKDGSIMELSGLDWHAWLVWGRHSDSKTSFPAGADPKIPTCGGGSQ